MFFFYLQPHRISVRSVTNDRRTSRDAACTMIIGRDTAHLGPSAVRASNITCSTAVISWLPANTNHQHVVCVNNVEVKIVKPGIYRQTITGTIFIGNYLVPVVQMVGRVEWTDILAANIVQYSVSGVFIENEDENRINETTSKMKVILDVWLIRIKFKCMQWTSKYIKI